MEKCEKIPAESFESRKTYDNQQREVRLWPRVDREGKSYGDAGYVVPSPPEREQHQPLQTLNHADFEAYIRNYPESQVGNNFWVFESKFQSNYQLNDFSVE